MRLIVRRWIDTRHAARLVRQQWLDDDPFGIGQLKTASRHQSPQTMGGLESFFRQFGIRLCVYGLAGTRRTADREATVTASRFLVGTRDARHCCGPMPRYGAVRRQNPNANWPSARRIHGASRWRAQAPPPWRNAHWRSANRTVWRQGCRAVEIAAPSRRRWRRSLSQAPAPPRRKRAARSGS